MKNTSIRVAQALLQNWHVGMNRYGSARWHYCSHSLCTSEIRWSLSKWEDYYTALKEIGVRNESIHNWLTKGIPEMWKQVGSGNDRIRWWYGNPQTIVTWASSIANASDEQAQRQWSCRQQHLWDTQSEDSEEELPLFRGRKTVAHTGYS